MTQYDVIVDVNELKNKETLINQKFDELYDMIKKYQEMIDETEEYYNTPSSKIYRYIAHRYLDVALLYLNKDYKPYVDKMDNIIDVYNDFYLKTASNVGKSDDYEV